MVGGPALTVDRVREGGREEYVTRSAKTEQVPRK